MIGDDSWAMWVGITFIFVVGASVIVPFYLRHLSRVKELETLVKLAEGAGDLRENLLKLLEPRVVPHSDLRKGLIFIAIGLPLLIASLLDSQPIQATVMGGIPLLTGAAYLFVARLSNRNTNSQKD